MGVGDEDRPLGRGPAGSAACASSFSSERPASAMLTRRRRVGGSLATRRPTKPVAPNTTTSFTMRDPTEPMSAVRVLIADDHPVFRAGLRALMGEHRGPRRRGRGRQRPPRGRAPQRAGPARRGRDGSSAARRPRDRRHPPIPRRAPGHRDPDAPDARRRRLGLRRDARRGARLRDQGLRRGVRDRRGPRDRPRRGDLRARRSRTGCCGSSWTLSSRRHARSRS